jgi:hypothetical protein
VKEEDEEKVEEPGEHGSNPGYVTQDLCVAYRQSLEQRFLTVDEKIRGLRNQIIGAITLSTTIISLIILILNLR